MVHVVHVDGNFQMLNAFESSHLKMVPLDVATLPGDLYIWQLSFKNVTFPSCHFGHLDIWKLPLLNCLFGNFGIEFLPQTMIF